MHTFCAQQMFSVMKEYDELAFLEEIQQELRSQGRTLLWGAVPPSAANIQCYYSVLFVYFQYSHPSPVSTLLLTGKCQ